MQRLFIFGLACALGVAAGHSDVAAQSSAVTPDCQPAWSRYQAAPGPKAFANGAKKGCGWQIKTETYPDMAAIRAQAVRQCAGESGAAGKCKIISQSN